MVIEIYCGVVFVVIMVYGVVMVKSGDSGVCSMVKMWLWRFAQGVRAVV